MGIGIQERLKYSNYGRCMVGNVTVWLSLNTMYAPKYKRFSLKSAFAYSDIGVRVWVFNADVNIKLFMITLWFTAMKHLRIIFF